MMLRSPQETFLDLHRARITEELWIVLLVPHSIHSSSGWEEPFLLFRRFHLQDPTDAAVTALLLCTDHRWRKASHHLIHQLAASGLLDEPALDRLAGWFVAADLEISVPRRLFEGTAVVVSPSRPDDATRIVDLPRTDQDPVGSHSGHQAAAVRVSRPIWPPLRRWAATRHLRSATTPWRDLVDIAAGLPGREAAMVLAGIMDAADSIPEDDRAAAIEVGLRSRADTTRLAALPALAALEGPGVAQARATVDPSAKVRAWADRDVAPTRRGGSPGPGGGHEPAASGHPSPGRPDQPTLF